MPDTRSLITDSVPAAAATPASKVAHHRNLHPIVARALSRSAKQRHLHQHARVIWLYGLSGAGKSTLALALERRLHADKFTTALLDGDNLRTGLNRDLSFSADDRTENIRRTAETARLFVQSGIIVIASLITPQRAHRDAARAIIGADDFVSVHVKASFETCANRDPKGLYNKAFIGEVAHFSGTSASPFEPPVDDEASIVIDTEATTPDEALARLHAAILPHIRA